MQQTFDGALTPAHTGDDRHCLRCGLEICRAPPAPCRACLRDIHRHYTVVLEQARHIAPNTVKAYALAFRKWSTYATSHGASPDALSPERLVAWIASMDEAGEMPSSVVATTSHLRGAVNFFGHKAIPGRWVWPEGDLALRAAYRRARSSSKGTARQAAPLRIPELRRIVASLAEERKRYPMATRDRAICLLWWSIAGRTEDIPRILWSHLSPRTDGGWDVLLRAGKTGARRATIYPASQHLELCPIAALEAWSLESLGQPLSELWKLDVAEVIGLDTPILRAFEEPGAIGAYAESDPEIQGLTLRGLRKLADRWFRRAGLRGYSPHSFRVGPLVVGYEAGAPGFELAQLSGHSSSAMLDRYLRGIARRSTIAFRLL